MENEQSAFKVIHWEPNFSKFERPVKLNVHIAVGGALIEYMPVLQFKWRLIGYIDNTAVLHFLAENIFVISNLLVFSEADMRSYMTESLKKVNDAIDERMKEHGTFFIENKLSDATVAKYYKKYMQIMDTFCK